MGQTAKLLNKDKLHNFLACLAGDYHLFVPDRRGTDISFVEFNKRNYYRFPFTNSLVPPAKGFLFPSAVKKYFDLPFEESWLHEGRKALFGIRPCDAQSLVLLDRALKDNEFYTEQRKNILIIAEGCTQPSGTCFCSSVQGGPFECSGADIFISDLDDRFLIEDISGRGSNYIQNLPDAGYSDFTEKEHIKSKAQSMIEAKLNLNSVAETLERLDKQFETQGVWSSLGDGCTNCARCTAVCPTCHCCFVVDDVVEMVCEGIGAEAKKYDPCMLQISLSGGLTGEVPRGSQRLQRRLMDKFCRTMKIVGQPFCVGCGRCIIHCDENVDILNVLHTVMKDRATV